MDPVRGWLGVICDKMDYYEAAQIVQKNVGTSKSEIGGKTNYLFAFKVFKAG